MWGCKKPYLLRAFPRFCLLCSARGQADCSSRSRASRSSSRGRGVGPVFRLFAPSSSSLFFRFSVLVSRVLSWSRRCALATSAIRGVSRGGCAASPCSGEVPPDLRGQWHQEHRAPTQEPGILQVSPYSFVVLNFLVGYLCSGSSVPCSTFSKRGLNSDLLQQRSVSVGSLLGSKPKGL